LGGVGVAGGEVVQERLVPRTASDVDRFAFQPSQRCVYGVLAGFDNGVLDSRVVRDGVEDADRLRGFERQIEAGYPFGVRANRLTIRREPTGAGCHPGEDRPQVIGGDIAGEAEGFRADAGPSAGGFARARVVVVQRLGDTGELVGLLADAEFGNAEHTPIRQKRAPGFSPGSRPDYGFFVHIHFW
jgi:hypothetical protein